MEVGHILQEVRVDAIFDSLGFVSQSARDLFKTQCSKWTTDPKALRAKSEAWRRLKHAPGQSSWNKHLAPLLENEEILRKIDPATASESQMEDWSQILFTGHFASMNFVPFILMYVAVSKIVLAPLVALAMPFMTMILPYIALKFIYSLPISWEGYWEMMKPMIFGSGGKPWSVGSLMQWGSMLMSFGHGVYIPLVNAQHCYKIDQLMLKGSKAIKDTIHRLNSIADTWVSWGLRKPWKFIDPDFYGDERQIMAWIVEDKTLLPSLYRAIGLVEITARISSETALVPVDWVESSRPHCNMQGAQDPLLDKDKRVPFHLILGSQGQHSICTGPNRGGKSTFLRTVLTNLLFAHGWGVAFAKKCTLTPVEWIISSLRLEDRPGEQSLFEREVTVAGEIVKRVKAKQNRGWVIIDELFHTTNPPDAATASQIFLQQLWESRTVASIVSTHLFLHATSAPEHVQRLCVDSRASSEMGKIEYTYKVCQGVNMMSSVQELLVESGIIEELSAVSWEPKTSAGEEEENAE